MTDQPSLLSRVTAGTVLLLLLVFGMTLLGVNAIRALDDAVQEELATLRERTSLAQAVTRDVVTAVRAGDRLAQQPGDTLLGPEVMGAFADLGRSANAYAQIPALTESERETVARVTVGVRRLESLSLSGDPGRGPVADTLLSDLRALVAIQEVDAARRAAALAAGS